MLFLFAFSICISMYAIYLRKKQQEIISLNQERQRENEWIEQSIKQKQYELDNLTASTEYQSKIIQGLNKAAEELRQDAKRQAQECYNIRVMELNEKYKKEEQDLKVKLEEHNHKVEMQEARLEELKAKQAAYIEAQKRQEEIDTNKDYYRLALSSIDIDDVSLLRNMQYKFTRKEAIDKLIWDVYYKPAYDTLMTHLFTSNNKACGIYKITDLTTGQAYIGQSVDMRERFRQHIKSALAHGTTSNKLYQTMKKSGVHNFTFEILEEVPRTQLNEREIYWIDFYQTKKFGLNSTSGGS